MCANMAEPSALERPWTVGPVRVRGLHLSDRARDLGVKPLLAELREQQPDLAAGAKDRSLRKALATLKVESEAKKTLPRLFIK